MVAYFPVWRTILTKPTRGTVSSKILSSQSTQSTSSSSSFPLSSLLSSSSDGPAKSFAGGTTGFRSKSELYSWWLRILLPSGPVLRARVDGWNELIGCVGKHKISGEELKKFGFREWKGGNGSSVKMDAMDMPLINWDKELEIATIENEMVVCDFGAWLFSQFFEKTEEEELLTVAHIIINLMEWRFYRISLRSAFPGLWLWLGFMLSYNQTQALPFGFGAKKMGL